MSKLVDPIEVKNLVEGYLEFGKSDVLNEVFGTKKTNVKKKKLDESKKLNEASLESITDKLDQISSDIMRLSKRWQMLAKPDKEDMGMPSLNYSIESVESELQTFLKMIKKDYVKFGL